MAQLFIDSSPVKPSARASSSTSSFSGHPSSFPTSSIASTPTPASLSGEPPSQPPSDALPALPTLPVALPVTGLPETGTGSSAPGPIALEDGTAEPAPAPVPVPSTTTGTVSTADPITVGIFAVPSALGKVFCVISYGYLFVQHTFLKDAMSLQRPLLANLSSTLLFTLCGFNVLGAALSGACLVAQLKRLSTGAKTAVQGPTTPVDVADMKEEKEAEKL
ncbi:hypothetical protein B0H19DRAFT_1256634 [Mycena capillaripes]|nr:hypothetical protein B0H19DRAFT_1256634 [Mycena capillaripes]